MMNLWNEIQKEQEFCLKLVPTGPMGVGKSYISYFLAAMAYARGWKLLYIADAGELRRNEKHTDDTTLVEAYASLNTLSKEEENRILSHSFSFRLSRHCIFALLRSQKAPSLVIIDEHDEIANHYDAQDKVEDLLYTPYIKLQVWGNPECQATRIVLCGSDHSTFERKYLQNGMERYIRAIGPLSEKDFEKLFNLISPELAEIYDEIKNVTNRVPREYVRLVQHLNVHEGTIASFQEERNNNIRQDIQNFFERLSEMDKLRIRNALAAMFVPTHGSPQFPNDFLDLGLVYREIAGESRRYFPLYPAAERALLDLYFSMPIPKDIVLKALGISGKATL